MMHGLEAAGDITETLKVRKDILAFEFDRPEMREPIEGKGNDIFLLEKLRGIAAPVKGLRSRVQARD